MARNNSPNAKRNNLEMLGTDANTDITTDPLAAAGARMPRAVHTAVLLGLAADR